MKGARSLTDTEITNVFNNLSTLRDKSLFLLGVKCGMRISELLSLKVSSVLEYGKVGSQVTVAKCNTKGKIESRTLPLTASARTVLQEYLDSMENVNPAQPLFKSTQDNKAISRVQAHKILKKAFNSLQLTGNCSTHTLRKSYCQRVHVALGNDIRKTQVAMGHKSLSSTASYLAVDTAEVNAAILAQG